MGATNESSKMHDGQIYASYQVCPHPLFLIMQDIQRCRDLPEHGDGVAAKLVKLFIFPCLQHVFFITRSWVN